jgi:hypothetical protein
VRRDYDYLATGQTAHCQPFVMRLQHPDDELGAMLLMNLPSVVVHAVDNWSPLAPRPTERRRWEAAGDTAALEATTPQRLGEEGAERHKAAESRFPDVPLREVLLLFLSSPPPPRRRRRGWACSAGE